MRQLSQLSDEVMMSLDELSNFKAVILCGGQGTRIRGVADNIPKPLIDIGGKPILWHIMKIYSYYGIRKFILCLGFKGDTIIDYFKNYNSRHNDFTMKIFGENDLQFHPDKENHSDVAEWEITFALTGEHTMTGGRIKRIEKYIDEKMFFATYGDGVSNVNIQALYRFHCSHNKIATLTGVHLPTTFGIVEANESGCITSFREKPVLPGRINGGFFVFNREVFDFIEEDSTILEDIPFKTMVKTNDIRMFPWDGFWHCMDTLKDHQELNKMWYNNNAPWKLWN